jgi:hypothetical protein
MSQSNSAQLVIQKAGPKKKPIPRSKVYDLYWKFAAERQAIFERRIAGSPPPWSDNPIFQRFKFCNVFRAADRVSQYLIRDVAYCPTKSTNADRIFQIVAFRTFSKPETWKEVIKQIGRPPTLDDLASGDFERALSMLKARGNGLYTGAFILCATKAFGFDEKHKNHVGLFKNMFFDGGMAEKIENAKSLEKIVEILESFPLTGPFMSYQIAIDLNYSDIIDFDENDFTQAGPGSLRGIRKAFEDIGDYTPAEIILWMVERQDQEFERLGLEFNGLYGRKLHAIDCQGLFCELDKYCREAVPELASSRSRIKTLFRPLTEPLKLFFPPKWKLNQVFKQSGADKAPLLAQQLLPAIGEAQCELPNAKKLRQRKGHFAK